MWFHTLNTDCFQEVGCHSDCFHICRWIARTKALHTDLVELTQATCLWALIAEHWPHVVELAWFLNFWCEEFIFHIRTNNWCCSLWTESDMAVTLVVKVIHFLGYDISCVSNRTTDDFVVLKNRRAYFCIVVAFEDFTRKSFNVLPFGRLSR